MGNFCKKKTIQEKEESILPKNSNDKNKIKDDSYKEYFKLIKMKLKKFYEENQNNPFNISLSLDKKDFSTIITTKKISIDPNQKFIYWKDYLTNYFQKQTNKGYQWAKEINE